MAERERSFRDGRPPDEVPAFLLRRTAYRGNAVMLLSNERIFWLTIAVFVPLAVGITLWKNSEWALEVRSLKDLRFLEVDGFIAPMFLFAAFPVMAVARAVAVRFDLCDKAYAELFVAVAALVFSAGFSLSAFRQTSLAGKLVAVVTLLVCGAFFLIGLGVAASWR